MGMAFYLLKVVKSYWEIMEEGCMRSKKLTAIRSLGTLTKVPLDFMEMNPVGWILHLCSKAEKREKERVLSLKKRGKTHNVQQANLFCYLKASSLTLDWTLLFSFSLFLLNWVAFSFQKLRTKRLYTGGVIKGFTSSVVCPMKVCQACSRMQLMVFLDGDAIQMLSWQLDWE